MSEVVKYFGYGANREERMMSAITGRPVDELVGRPGILKGFGLAIQNVENIPNKLVEGSVLHIPPRKIILDSWNEDFRSYVIYPRLGGLVAGTLWDLTPDERARVEDWELVGDWYQEARGLVDTGEDTILAVTESIGPSQLFDRVVNGLDYDSWLQPVEDFERIAAQTRADYDSRNSQ